MRYIMRLEKYGFRDNIEQYIITIVSALANLLSKSSGDWSLGIQYEGSSSIVYYVLDKDELCSQKNDCYVLKQ